MNTERNKEPTQKKEVKDMNRAYILIGKDGSQIGYKTGKDTEQKVIERYKEYTNLKEIWFYGSTGRLEKIHKCN